MNRSIDIYAKKEYNYEYEDGKILRAVENNITLNDCEIVTGRTLVNTVRYYYDATGQLTKKIITPAGGTAFTYTYTNAENANTTVQFTAGGQTVTSSSQTDSLGRKTLDKLEFGTESISRQFSYHAGKETSEHCSYNKLKDAPTTQLVSKIVLSNGRTISYEYDAEERITKVVDSDDATITYTYDSLGQLLTEKVNGTVVNSMTYDNYGNILTKNGKTYTYDSTWKDLLTSYNGQSITYDAQGNPTTYLGHTLTWEKSRQLKSFDSNTYTYTADGIRTGKIVNGIKHKYIIDGTNILRETWGNNTLISIYDSEETICGIIYNNVPYYFLKNLQGDIIAITDKTGTIVTEYLYDAWGNFRAIYDCSDDNIGTINPYRYRSYYYDEETGLYYLQNRYYNPTVGVFLNTDSVAYINANKTILSYNLFSYCLNNPINRSDETGCFSVSEFWQYVNALPIVKGITKLAGFAWDSRQRIWYSLMYPIQRKLGYCDLYDTLAPLAGIYISHKKMSFKYNNKTWMLWLWKGQYGITTGAEIGLYIRAKTMSATVFGKKYSQYWYRCAEDNERIKMSFTLYKNGKKMFSRNLQTHWWLTGFKPGIKLWWERLTMSITLNFQTVEMAKSFCANNQLRQPKSSEVNFGW